MKDLFKAADLTPDKDLGIKLETIEKINTETHYQWNYEFENGHWASGTGEYFKGYEDGSVLMFTVEGSCTLNKFEEEEGTMVEYNNEQVEVSNIVYTDSNGDEHEIDDKEVTELLNNKCSFIL